MLDNMKKILVVFTGGTIGSKLSGSTINVDDTVSRIIINNFLKEYPDAEVSFESIQPLNILSENFTPAHWATLYDSLFDIDLSGYAGVIITHGSDTISYTASFMGLTLCNTSIPIVLTCSNYVLGHEKSNGQQNFNNCVWLILKGGKAGVFVVYQNSDGKNVVYLATRIQEANPYNDQFTTCGGVDLGEIKNRELLLNSSPSNPNLPPIEDYRPIVKKSIFFENQIGAIKAYPGLNYDNFVFGNKTKAVLCNLYHSSSNCIEKEEYSITAFISRCAKQGIDVYLMSFKRSGGEQYFTTKQIVASGGIPLVNISFEAAYVKLNLAYNQKDISPREFMKQNLYHETISE